MTTSILINENVPFPKMGFNCANDCGNTIWEKNYRENLNLSQWNLKEKKIEFDYVRNGFSQATNKKKFQEHQPFKKKLEEDNIIDYELYEEMTTEKERAQQEEELKEKDIRTAQINSGNALGLPTTDNGQVVTGFQVRNEAEEKELMKVANTINNTTLTNKSHDSGFFDSGFNRAKLMDTLRLINARKNKPIEKDDYDNLIVLVT